MNAVKFLGWLGANVSAYKKAKSNVLVHSFLACYHELKKERPDKI
ncbi:hypothetical protein AR1Y2_0958 [Anaerostipes rhamnosivorans]|uniref:Uncharacterized protein n=1 Tax=Anaerostipes rhamnosivorans TaxID=1229621 RepID=A0A4P8IA02_9FIRM|nr:hypothetical protein AR1Y2_0958 [Anaerostipes rhamnosivorans]